MYWLDKPIEMLLDASTLKLWKYSMLRLIEISGLDREHIATH
jgi:hypothetical protein